MAQCRAGRQRYGLSSVFLDGLDNNDQTKGFAFTGVLRTTLDSTQEFAWRDLRYNPNTIAAANNRFNKQAELIEGLPNIPGKLIRNAFGGMGG